MACVRVRRRGDSKKEAMRIFSLCDSHPNLIKLCVLSRCPLCSLSECVCVNVCVCLCYCQREAAALLTGASTKACSHTHCELLCDSFLSFYSSFCLLLWLYCTARSHCTRWKCQERQKLCQTGKNSTQLPTYYCVNVCLAVIEHYLSILNVRMLLQAA